MTPEGAVKGFILDMIDEVEYLTLREAAEIYEVDFRDFVEALDRARIAVSFEEKK